MEPSPHTRLITLRPLVRADIDAIATWHYDPPYDIYDVDKNAMKAAQSDLKSTFRAISDTAELVGYCSFGHDGQVPGGDYLDPAPDIGIGIRPDLVGRGHASAFLAPVIAEVTRMALGIPLRVTVAALNERSIRAWTRQKFVETSRFTGFPSGLPFVILTRPDNHLLNT